MCSEIEAMQSELHKTSQQQESVEELKMFANHLQQQLNDTIMESNTSLLSDACTETDEIIRLPNVDSSIELPALTVLLFFVLF